MVEWRIMLEIGPAGTGSWFWLVGWLVGWFHCPILIWVGPVFLKIIRFSEIVGFMRS